MDSQDYPKFSFSIDRGGTFTDIYCEIKLDNATTKSHVMKLLSVDPANYADAPTEGIRRILSMYLGSEIPRAQKIPTGNIVSIRMGTTVATNALLERKGDRVALLISEGLKDVLLIGNQSRPKIFDLEIKRPDAIYEEVVEVTERIRPLKIFEEGKVPAERVVTGINQERYVIVKELDLAKVEEDLRKLH